MKRRIFFPLMVAAGASVLSCVPDFDTQRATPPRKSVGSELYTLVCDRVGAQALREDVTGLSFRKVCHPDSKGRYAERVDTEVLPPIRASVDAKGKPVASSVQRENRARRVARVEALRRRRDELVAAFDAVLPKADFPLKDLTRTAAEGCDKKGAEAGEDALLQQFVKTLERFLDLYNDETIPNVTRALGAMLQAAERDAEVQGALARLDARQGYRPTPIGLGVIRPVLAYPKLFSLANTLLGAVSDDADPYNPERKGKTPGKMNAEFREMLDVMRGELRLPAGEALPPIKLDADAGTSVSLLSRPRTKIEIAQQALLFTSAEFGSGPPRFVVRRDSRGYAGVALQNGKPLAPFAIDASTGLPQIDELGQFVVDGDPFPSPFFALGAPDGERDPDGRALYNGAPMHDYIDASRVYMGSLLRDIKPLLDPAADDDRQTLFNVLAGIPVLMGGREESPSGKFQYPPLSDDGPPVNHTYRRFRSEDSPLVDAVYALGQTLAEPALDDALHLMQKLLNEHPQKVARLVGIGFQLKEIADKHPEARVPEASTIWDDMLSTLGKIAHAPGLLEDLLLAFGDERTVKLDKVFAAYMDTRDRITYFRDPSDPTNLDKLNGPSYNATKKNFDALSVPVDRSKPDSGDNQSSLQRFLHTLHDINGLAACTKHDGVARINIELKDLKIPVPFGFSLPGSISLDYPKDYKLFSIDILGNPIEAEIDVLTPLCAFVGAPRPPKVMPQCGILRFDNVATMLVGVATGNAQLDIRDQCLLKLMNTPSLTGLVGGTDAFLESISGIKGFKLNPTVPGIARMAHFETPYSQWGGFKGDQYYPKTRDFFKDIIDPIPTMVCDEAPFTDPSDGKVIKLRSCGSFKDTIRGRHADAVFPLEQFNFVENIQPLALAFANNNQPLLFVELFDVMHLHWGSEKQTKDECDPSLPRTHARWCAQSGVVTYEPLLVEMLQTDLFPTLAEFVNILKAMKMPRCEQRDGSGKCAKTSEVTGIQVLAEAVRLMADPARHAGLIDRKGRNYAVRNDGVQAPLTPLVMLIDALKGFDTAFAKNASASPGGEDVRRRWKLARSQITDTFFAVDGAGNSASFRNPAVWKLLPRVVEVLRSQIRARCPDSKATCAWARSELAKNAAETIDGPTAAAALGLADAFRSDPEVRAELEHLVTYLLESVTNDAGDTTLAASTDLLQWLGDDANMTPIYRMASTALARRDDDDPASLPGLVPAVLDLLTRLFAPGYTADGERRCSSKIDPHETLAVIMKNLVTPLPETSSAPIEVILSVIADVNRFDPSDTAKLNGADYGNMSKEIADFLLNPGTGLEQVYDVIRQTTGK